MALMGNVCPECGSKYDPAHSRCEKCGCIIIADKGNFVDMTRSSLDFDRLDETKHPGVYVFGRLLGKGEKPITLGAANYFTGATSAGGKLLLTNRSLHFSAHAINVGRTQATIPLQTIQDVKVGLNLLVSQHIMVRTATETHKFVVYHGKEWVASIQNAIRHVND